MKKSPCTPKTFGIAKNCVFCREILRKPCRKRSFRYIASLLLSFKERSGVPRGSAPWGEERGLNTAGALPLLPRRGGFLKKSPCTPKTFGIAKNCVFCREILRNPCRKRSFRLYRFFASFFQRKKRGSKGRRPLGKCVSPKDAPPGRGNSRDNQGNLFLLLAWYSIIIKRRKERKR